MIIEIVRNQGQKSVELKIVRLLNLELELTKTYRTDRPFRRFPSASAYLVMNLRQVLFRRGLLRGLRSKLTYHWNIQRLIRTFDLNLRLKKTVRTKMPSQSMLNTAEEITSLHYAAFNPLLLGRSALDMLHLTRYFQRN